jgi:hypothetical protein
MNILPYHLNKKNDPVVIEHKGMRLAVKLSSGIGKNETLINEWLGSSLANLLGLNVFKPYWVILPGHAYKKYRLKNLSRKLSDRLDRSAGYNIGFPFLKNLKPFFPKPQAALNPYYLLDVFLLNTHRTPSQPNIFNYQQQLVVSDYHLSLLTTELREQKDLYHHPHIMQCFLENPFYNQVSEEQALNFYKKLRSSSWESCFDKIPEDLLSEEDRDFYIKRMRARLKDPAWFVNLIQVLNSTRQEHFHFQ